MAILNPVEKPADAYAPCWCGSGKKWKFCHRTRHLERRREFGESFERYNKASYTEYCSHPEAPSGCGYIIDAHSLQRRGGLSAISEAGHVLSSVAGLRQLARNNGMIVPTKVGIGRASTFRGYCDLHDGNLFGRVEAPAVSLDREAAFLLSMRAVALERYRKQQMLRGYHAEAKTADAGRSFREQAFIQELVAQVIESSTQGLKDADHNKALYDKAFQDPGRLDFSCYIVEFDTVLPIASSGAFAPLTTIAGAPLQTLGDSSILDFVALNLTVLNGRSVLTLGSITNDGPATKFIESFAATENAAKADLSCQTAIRCLENTFYRPSWWDGLNAQGREAISHEVHRMADSFKFGDQPENALRLFQGNVLSELVF